MNATYLAYDKEMEDSINTMFDASSNLTAVIEFLEDYEFIEQIRKATYECNVTVRYFVCCVKG